MGENYDQSLCMGSDISDLVAKSLATGGTNSKQSQILDLPGNNSEEKFEETILNKTKFHNAETMLE